MSFDTISINDIKEKIAVAVKALRKKENLS
jgi:hypothetical protein